MKNNKIAIIALTIFSGSFFLYFILSMYNSFFNEEAIIKDRMSLLTDGNGPSAIGISREDSHSMLVVGELQDFRLFNTDQIQKEILNNQCFYYLKFRHSIVYCKKDNKYYWLAYNHILTESDALPIAKNHLRILLDVR